MTKNSKLTLPPIPGLFTQTIRISIPFRILGGKAYIKRVQIDPKTTETWSTNLNIKLFNYKASKKLTTLNFT